jgi:hypothetical protein
MLSKHVPANERHTHFFSDTCGNILLLKRPIIMSYEASNGGTANKGTRVMIFKMILW